MIITLPWDALMGDNHRLMPSNRGRLIANPTYRNAKTRAGWLMRAFHGSSTPLNQPVKVEGRLYFPDARKRDAGNYRKLVTDAMTDAGILADDSLIHDERWIRVGIDRANPRMELTVSVIV